MRVASRFIAFLAAVCIFVKQMEWPSSVVRPQEPMPVYVLGEIPLGETGASVVVNDVVANSLPNFEAIARQIGETDRTSWLSDNLQPFVLGSTWHVMVLEDGIVNDQHRLSVCANADVEVESFGSTGELQERYHSSNHRIYEIWHLAEGEPVLLERSFSAFGGVRTHDEFVLPAMDPSSPMSDQQLAEMFAGDTDPDSDIWIGATTVSGVGTLSFGNSIDPPGFDAMEQDLLDWMTELGENPHGNQ